MKQVKYGFPLFLSFFLLVAHVPEGQAAPDPEKPTPPVGWVQARVFHNLSLQEFKLEGVLRTPKQLYPIELQTRDREMVYTFKNQPLQIRVVLDPASAVVERRKSSTEEWQPVTGKALFQPILDSDATYEDIGLNFIFWDRLVGVGSDSIKTLSAWAFEAEPPDNAPSLYAKVRYWISSDYFAFLRVDAYNKENQVVKRVEVNGVQRIGDAYVIKEMQIATMIPGRELSASRTYIDVNSGAPGSGL